VVFYGDTDTSKFLADVVWEHEVGESRPRLIVLDGLENIQDTGNERDDRGSLSAIDDYEALNRHPNCVARRGDQALGCLGWTRSSHGRGAARRVATRLPKLAAQRGATRC